MKFSFRPLLKWSEPKCYVLYEKAVAQRKPKRWMLNGVLVAVAIIGVFIAWYRPPLAPTKHPLPLGQFVLLVICSLAFLACFLWLLSRFIGRSIHVYDKALVRQSINQLIIPVKIMVGYSFEVVEESGYRTEVVWIRTKRGTSVTLGLSDPSQMAYLEKYFAERGVRPLGQVSCPDEPAGR
ncbi:MAG: hypothetical protein ACQKBW_09580 [Puniceicoccales bacterium]